MHIAPTQPTSDDAATDKPLVVELRQAEKLPNGTFRPQASLKLLPVLRASGLLLALPGEDLKNLMFLLSFLTPNGDCLAAVPQLAAAMRASALKVRARMQRLLDFRWQGEPLVVLMRSEAGLETYTVNTRLIAYEHLEHPVPEAAAPVPRAAGREAVIAHSREHYARPRAEVERTIAELNGWPLPEEPFRGEPEAPAQPESPGAGDMTALGDTSDPLPPDVESHGHVDSAPDSAPRQRAHVRQQLLRLGVSGDIADDLLSRFDLIRIQRQLRWLRYRKAKNPAGFVVAAIEDDYAAPAVLWHHFRRHNEPAPDYVSAPADVGDNEPPRPPAA